MVEVKGPSERSSAERVEGGPGGGRATSEGGVAIGEVARRTGIAASALRFYEDEGLITASRNAAGHRRYAPDTIRRVSFIRTAQRVGLSLAEIAEALGELPDARTPTRRDWARLAERWDARLAEQIAVLRRMREHLDGCIGCGCLSLESCAIWNPDDLAGAAGSGPRYLLSDDRPPGVG